jgi:hypothetical protein
MEGPGEPIKRQLCCAFKAHNQIGWDQQFFSGFIIAKQA